MHRLGWEFGGGRRVSLALAIAMLAASLVGCGGCSASYVVRAAYEEARILWSREPIAELLADDAMPELERSNLELIEEARTFAAERLQMNVGGAYGSVAEVSPDALVWGVSASPRFKLQAYTWWFPIVGDVSYKGFFHREEADAEAERLEALGFDTYVRDSMAFSTLGWFDDPVLSSWLKAEPVRLVRLLLHELLHRTTYLSGQTRFNESFATFVGNTGAISMFEQRDGTDSAEAQEARALWESQLDSSQRWAPGLARLRALYAAGVRGEKTEAEMLVDRDKIFAGFGASVEINNAVILARSAYQSDLAGFACVLVEEGGDVARALARLRRQSEENPDDPFSVLGRCRAEQE